MATRTIITGIANGPDGINDSGRKGIRPGGRRTLGSRKGIITSPNRKPIAAKAARRGR